MNKQVTEKLTTTSCAPLFKKKSIDFTGDVIVIDDDQDDREIISILFKKMDRDQYIRFFKDGEDFLNMMQGQDIFWQEDQQLGLPKLIIIDMEMPLKNGIQTLIGLRSNPLWRDVPVILVTGTSDDKKIEEAYELGANAFLSKPFRQTDLIQAVYHGLNYSHSMI